VKFPLGYFDVLTPTDNPPIMRCTEWRQSGSS
jgi:hypothetical protein